MIRKLLPFLLGLAVLIGACGGSDVKKDPILTHPAHKHLQKGVGWYQRGCFHKSLEELTKAHELFTASDLLPGVAMSLNNIGNVYRYIGDTRSAVLFYQEAYAIYSHLENHDGAIQALSNHAAILIQNDQLDEAAATIQKATTLAESVGRVAAQVLNNQGILLTRQKRFMDAESILALALEATSPQNVPTRATSYSALGNLMTAKEEYTQAIKFYQKALAIDQQIDFHPGIADNLNAIGNAYFQMQHYAQAAVYLQRSVKIYAMFRDTKQVSSTMGRLEECTQHADIDLTVTHHFVEKWLKGEVLEHPCP
jgi:tetratricopeptide (TPR) repeat protein